MSDHEQPTPESESNRPAAPSGPETTVTSSASSVAYSSRATKDFSDDELAELLEVSRRNNDRLGLTGVLLYRDGRFLQYLEGPEPVVTERIDIIAADARHDDFQIRFRQPISARLFPSWSMGFERVAPDATEDIPGLRKSFVDVSKSGDDRSAHGAMSDVARWFAIREERTRPSGTPAPEA